MRTAEPDAAPDPARIQVFQGSLPTERAGQVSLVVSALVLLRVSRSLRATGSSLTHVSRKPDARPCCCGLKPLAQSVPGNQRSWLSRPKRSGSCGASRQLCQADGNVGRTP